MSSCSGGLNEFKTLNVPAGNGPGTDLDVSDLVGKKTLYLSGVFDGEYVIEGSHDDVRFVPVAQFVGQESTFGTSGPQTVKRDVELTLKTLRVQRVANKSVNIVVGAQNTCPCN